MSEPRRLYPKGSLIQASMLTKTQYHVLKFYYLPNKQIFEATDKHAMGDCRHCKIWKPVKEETE